ncbi:MAG: hypothetical protein H7Z41_12060 [Cytophagales bacterium]|nr:hypothetical protein [Armatimonadota bacterium]
MATTPAAPNLDQGWSPEPELRENAPRRIEPVFDYPDLNKPNVTVFSAVAGALAALGLVLFVLGLTGRGFLFTGLGLVLLGGGIGLFIIIPQKAKTHEERARHLVEQGLPIMANVLTSQNMTGDSTYGRSVRYQVVLPGGEMVHRDVNADERRLPKMIPGKATALIDMNTSDVELYCVLPFRAMTRPGTVPETPQYATPVAVSVPPVAKTDPMAGLPVADPVSSGGGGSMGSIGNLGAPPPRQKQSQTQERTAPETKPESPKEAPPPSAPAPSDNKLPWE